MANQSLARKYRPKNFDDLVGQPYVSKLLKKAFLNNKVAQSYLFTGTRGVGKTSIARLLALTLNCLDSKDGNPCLKCDSCKDIQSGNSLDVREIDGASNNKVDDVRELRETIDYLPTFGKYKIVIIDEVHMLTTSAFNALLKTLEEPPSHLVFIFATTEAHKIPDTILSRCQRYDFKRISESEIVDRFKFILKEEGLSADDSALFMIAKKANGSMRDGLSLLDQIISFSDKHIDSKMVEAFLGIIGDEVFVKIFLSVANKNFDEIIEIINYINDNGHDFGDVLDNFITFTRNTLMAKTAPNYWAKMQEYNPKTKEVIVELSQNFAERDLIRILSILDKTNQELRFSQNDKMAFEIALYKITQLFVGVTMPEAIKNFEVKELVSQNSIINSKEILEKLNSADISEPIVENISENVIETINENIIEENIEHHEIKETVEETNDEIPQQKSVQQEVIEEKNVIPNNTETQQITQEQPQFVETLSYADEDVEEVIEYTINQANEILKKEQIDIFGNIELREFEGNIIASVKVVNNTTHKKIYEDLEGQITLSIKKYIPKNVIFEYIVTEDSVLIHPDEDDPQTIFEEEVKKNPILKTMVDRLNLDVIEALDKK